MVVKKKISPSIEEFIDKGAPVKASKDMDFKSVLIRIPTSILAELDERLKNKLRISRTQWIVEAIHEKLRDFTD